MAAMAALLALQVPHDAREQVGLAGQRLLGRRAARLGRQEPAFAVARGARPRVRARLCVCQPGPQRLALGLVLVQRRFQPGFILRAGE